MAFDTPARFSSATSPTRFTSSWPSARINLYAQTFIVVFTKKMDFSTRAWELGTLGVYWVWFLALLSFLPNNYHTVAFVLSSFAATGIQHVQFVLNHFSSPVYDGKPQSKTWSENQPLCEKYKLPYESLSWLEANLRVLRTLKGAALEARDVSKPAPPLSKSLIWEAANARG
ncbi:hypothetical protein R1sor_011582 [Riccia sorocarpa]|uniref:Uncharacterized protein n=1 Tax=Riccia sorocarpa TaxID=122646 RepID=A0ABD3I2E4_9MARC